MNSLSSGQLTDEEVVSMVQSGQVDYFGILVKRYEEKMMRYARKFLFNYHDAEDVVQDVFLKAYVNIQSFDTSKKFSPWLYRIAHNEFINLIKKKKKEPLSFFNFDILFPYAVSEKDADKQIDKQEIHRILDEGLNKLDAKYREPLVLYYFEELSYKEIADILRIPISTVGVRLRRGKKIIKSFCKKLGY